ncbi:MAG: hypothetical protein COY53_00915 [Elusimicrobia bacterium CG_4_10_14_0_8_um_filter_37_32]|nr:MAG: hypothetical protein COS17_05180 [Elusimicrobia bacterium CG02_land_8_20_14_3_00_37_13]PIZ14183.1 MAG: hypothetical protein COY53_00915 [Elusimicrobia bacterium CG_4_10_14_0_8_um_filter_37_32]
MNKSGNSAVLLISHNFKEATIGKYINKKQSKTYPGTDIQYLPGMHGSGCSRKTNTGTALAQAVGPCCYTQKNQRSGTGSSLITQKKGQEKISRQHRGTPGSSQRTGRIKRGTFCRRARICLAKKKSALGIKGTLKGHFSKEIKTFMVKAIEEAIGVGISQAEACKIVSLNPRKFRRWANPKAHRQRTSWNKILPQERQAILSTAYDEKLADKPLSHLMVHGHTSGNFIASISTISRVFKAAAIPREVKVRRKSASYVDAHDLLDAGFSLLCYDGSLFDTDSGVIVWAIPVLLLPQRVLLHVGHSLGGVSSRDLTNAVDEALVSTPQYILDLLIAHSDRGSAMKANKTKEHIRSLLGFPVHYGRPNTPDDVGWIEALVKTMKYHRDSPSHFPMVDDVLQWFKKFQDIYNNDPHSSLNYVTPLQALSGEMEAILCQRKQNYLDVRRKRLYNYHVNKQLLCKQEPEVVLLST